MAQATFFSKNKVEIIIDVNHLNLAPRIAIMFPVHSLHLPRVIVETNNKGEFNKTSPLNPVRML
jgi:hypothetical protein